MNPTPPILARLRHRAAAAWFGLARGLRLRWKNHLGTLLMVVGVFAAVQAWQFLDPQLVIKQAQALGYAEGQPRGRAAGHGVTPG